jgi:Tfp pilus assembly pilus retraction ATPase PilT
MQLLVTERGEAVHLHEGEAPVLEIKRVLHRVEGPRLAAGDTERLLQSIASEDDLEEFKSGGTVSFYHRLQESAAFQIMAFKEDGHVRLEIRRFKG